MNSKQRLRTRLVLILIIIGAGVLASSLYWTQIVQGPSYAAKASKQYAKPTTSVFDRGTIYFQSKDGTNVAAATVAGGHLVYMNPMLVKDPAETYSALSNYLTLDKADFMQRAGRPNDPYEEIAHRVSDQAAQSISGLSLKGIGVVRETWRSYPGGELASHNLGLIGENDDSTVEGRYGLERTYQSVLARTGIGPSVNVFAELFSGLRDSVFGAGASEGIVVTTLEPTVEAYVEKTLAKTSAEWKPDEIGAIVIDPQTGKIVAMSSLPTFDPNDVSKIKNAGIFSNPLVEHVYELGSIMKPLTMATGLDSGAVKPSSTYDDTGCMTLDTKKICNFDGKARGVIPMQQILSQSLNVGAATVALKVGTVAGKGTFAKYFSSFGLGDKTGIDQPNEAKGIIGNLNNGQDIAVATAAYGQGIAISPVEMVRALSVLANDGYLITPHLVKEIDYTDGTIKKIVPGKGAQVLKQQTVQDVTKMLIEVVDKSLANGAVKMDRYSVAAKTGTAQIPDPVHGGYYSDRYLHSFFGYFPAYDPKFLVFLYQIYPKGAEYASATLTSPFEDITKFLINYYNIPPDR